MKVIYKIYVRDLVEILIGRYDGSYESAYQEVLVSLPIENNEYNTEEEALAALEDYMSWSTDSQKSEYTILKFYRK